LQRLTFVGLFCYVKICKQFANKPQWQQVFNCDEKSLFVRSYIASCNLNELGKI
jgi:hypothetical protein